METQDIFLQYVKDKIESYEKQLKGIVYHMNRHKEILKRLEKHPEIKYVTVKQLDMFGT